MINILTKAYTFLYEIINTREKFYGGKESRDFFTHSSHLSQVMRTHSGEKAYECNECEKAFKKLSSFSHHLEITAERKPVNVMNMTGLSCRAFTLFCTREFTRVRNLMIIVDVENHSARILTLKYIRELILERNLV